MKILLNTTKTMGHGIQCAACPRPTEPVFAATAAELMVPLQRLNLKRLADQMALSPKLAHETQATIARWGHPDTPLAPALLSFTGIVYKYVDPTAWSAGQFRDAQRRLVILSGLYGLLRPLDNVAAYRLEMGSRFKPPRAANLVAFWREKMTAELNNQLKNNEAILNLAAQEYVKALNVAELKGPVVSPVFKEVRRDGSLKTAPVHAKIARGAMVKFIFTNGVKRPLDLLAFGELGWEASEQPPASGPWLFTRPATA